MSSQVGTYEISPAQVEWYGQLTGLIWQRMITLAHTHMDMGVFERRVYIYTQIASNSNFARENDENPLELEIAYAIGGRCGSISVSLE